MKRRLAIVFVAAATLLAPTLILAQNGPTLESLSERITALSERITGLEALWTSPAQPRELDDDVCLLGIDHSIRDETFIKHKLKWDLWPDMDNVKLHNVRYSRQTGQIIIVYQAGTFWPYRQVAEVWQGCDFLHSTDWAPVE